MIFIAVISTIMDVVTFPIPWDTVAIVADETVRIAAASRNVRGCIPHYTCNDEKSNHMINININTMMIIIIIILMPITIIIITIIIIIEIRKERHQPRGNSKKRKRARSQNAKENIKRLETT